MLNGELLGTRDQQNFQVTVLTEHLYGQLLFSIVNFLFITLIFCLQLYLTAFDRMVCVCVYKMKPYMYKRPIYRIPSIQ